MTTDAELLEKVGRARQYIITRPLNSYVSLFSYLVLKARIKVSPKVSKKRGALGCSVQSGIIYIAKDWTEEARPSQIANTILHEIGHLVRIDFTRAKERDMKAWNFVADGLINEWIHQSGVPDIEGTITKPMVAQACNVKLEEIDHYTTEQLVDMLVRNGTKFCDACGMIDPNSIGLGEPEPLDGKAKDGDGQIGITPTEPIDWSKEFKTAVDMIKSQGLTPSDDINAVNYELSKPQIHWSLRFNKVARGLIPTDYSMANFDKIMWIQFGYWMPDVDGPESNVVFIVDVSGSIGKDEFNAAASEAQGILDKYHARLFLITSDAAVCSADEVRNRLPKQISYAGGGTDFRPAFDYITKNLDESKYSFIVYFTDGYGTYPEKNPTSLPVVWVLTAQPPEAPPFGETIQYTQFKEM